MTGIKGRSSTCVPFLMVSGSFKRMGEIHGETYGQSIRNLFDCRYGLLRNSLNGGREKQIRLIAESLWNYLCKANENIAVEVESTARASHLHPWQLVVAGGFTDIMDVLSSNSKSDYHECTVAVDPEKGFIAGTWDSHPEAKDALILLERQPDIGPATLALTTAGWPCQQGINSYGVGFAITNLTPQKAANYGLVYIAANAILGTAINTSNILEKLIKETYCSGHSYIVLDTTGDAAIMETTHYTNKVYPITTLTTKANHYFGGSGSIDNNSNYAHYQSSIIREKELMANLSSLKGFLDFSHCLSKCPTVNRSDSTQIAMTCAYFFISVKEKTIWYSKGPALANAKIMLSKTLR